MMSAEVKVPIKAHIVPDVLRDDDLDNKRYVCFNCRGAGDLKIESINYPCQVCKGSKTISLNDEGMDLIRSVIDRQIRNLRNTLVVEQPQNSDLSVPYKKLDQQIKAEPKVQKGVAQKEVDKPLAYYAQFLKAVAPQHQYQVQLQSDFIQIIRCLLMDPFIFNFKFKNSSKVPFSKSTRIYRLINDNPVGSQKHELMMVCGGIQPGEIVEMNISMKALASGTEIFQLGFMNDKNLLKLFGPRFGYRLETYTDEELEMPDYDQQLFKARLVEVSRTFPGKKLQLDFLLEEAKKRGLDSKANEDKILEMLLKIYQQKSNDS